VRHKTINIVSAILANVSPHYAAAFGAKKKFHRPKRAYQTAPKTVE